MKRLRFAALVLLLLVLSATIAHAHPGDTDSSGGHYDSSTGEYHYHHGYPAHQHTNGRCPYDFDDRTGWNSGPSGSSSKFNGNPSAALWIILATLGVAALLYILASRHRAKAEEEAAKKIIALERQRQEQALQKAIPNLKQKVRALEREYLEIQTRLLTEEVHSPRQAAKVPEDSYLGRDGLPHQFGANTIYEDRYYFAFNESTSVFHKPSCRHAIALPILNFVDITMLDSSCRPKRFARPCRQCNPKVPGTIWIRAYTDILSGLDYFGVSVKDLKYPEKPKNHLIPHDTETVPYRSKTVTLHGVESSMISYVGYDKESAVVFVRMRKTDHLYTHSGISPGVYTQFIHAESLGRFYNKYIKKQKGE